MAHNSVIKRDRQKGTNELITREQDHDKRGTRNYPVSRDSFSNPRNS